ncbi:hypothetical protein [Streptomyces sp. ISL-100]|uniref:hypothetical protein n=1 Tax=Streptomyces sp. ISL-100 TaxID=2819173 RepID=UPI001BEA76E6|nr:hypothetical protein [Streptomyces sp. ISL-100]MBT2394825.1 hypothetical protein [Streptomyces sp. ISL-100]
MLETNTHLDTVRAVTDLPFADTLERHAGLEVIVPHCGRALPVPADRINGFMKLFMPSQDGRAPDTVAQLRRLHYDIAGPAHPRQLPADRATWQSLTTGAVLSLRPRRTR